MMRGAFFTERCAIQLGKEDDSDARQYDHHTPKQEYPPEQPSLIGVDEEQGREKGNGRPDRKNPHAPQKSSESHMSSIEKEA